MERIGIKELKAHLGTYVAKAEGGEYVVITHRGREVAELAPISEERRTMTLLAARGRARWTGGKPAGLRGIKVKGKPVGETVVEERR